MVRLSGGTRIWWLGGQWGERDKFINLCTTLDGAAKQVLREMPTGGTTEELQVSQLKQGLADSMAKTAVSVAI